MKTKLRIGIVVDQMLAGGVQLAAIEQVKELNKLGHTAKLLILMRKKYPTDFSYLVKGLPYQYLSDSYPSYLRKTIKFPIFSFLSTLHLASPFLAPKVISKDNYDILISWGTTTSLTTQAIFKRLKIPYIAIIHDPITYILEKVYAHTYLKYFFLFILPLATRVESSFVKDARATLLISNVHVDHMEKKYGVKAHVLPLGVSSRKTIPRKRGDYLLSFGRWQKEKHPDFLLKILKLIPEAKLIIAGTWINNNDLLWFKNKVKHDKLEKKVQIIPHFSNAQLTKICAQGRVWVHPHFEAFGLAALEAASQGLPIIIPAKSGVTENFVHNVDGFFPKEFDVLLYKNYLKKLLEDERLAYTMGKSAWEKVKNEFSWSAHTNKLLSIIELALRTKEKPRIVVLETGHVLGAPLAGGDRLMEPMAIRLANKYLFSIIVSSVGSNHWKNVSLEKDMIVLPRNVFDESSYPIHVFITYCIRMWQTYKALLFFLSKTSHPENHEDTIVSTPFVYSSTNILPDILPAYFAKKTQPDIMWIARVHHLIPPPQKREGKLIVNTIAYSMQILALFMMKAKADITIALNANVAKDLEKRGFRKEKLRVLGGGIEFEKIRSLKTHNKKIFHGIFLGRLHITKGVFDTIPIWKNITKKYPTAKLAIIGDGPIEIKKQLEEKIKNAQLTHNISLLGFLPDNEVYSLMKQAKVFLFLDHEAGWGLAVAEAMACKLPILGYDIGVLGNIFKKGYLKTRLGDFDAIAKHAITLFENKKYRMLLAQQAGQEAAQFDWSKTSTRFDKIIHALM